MENSTKLKNELAAVTVRQTEVADQLAAQITAETAQNAFIAGKGKLDASLAEQQKKTLLEQALESLKQSANELTAQYNTRLAAETRTAALDALAETANAAFAAKNEYFSLYQQFEADIAASAQTLFEQQKKFYNLRHEYQKGAAQAGMSASDLTARSVSDEARAVAGYQYPVFPPTTDGMSEVVTLALTILTNRQQNARDKEAMRQANLRNQERERKAQEAREQQSIAYRREQQGQAETIKQKQAVATQRAIDEEQSRAERLARIEANDLARHEAKKLDIAEKIGAQQAT